MNTQKDTQPTLSTSNIYQPMSAQSPQRTQNQGQLLGIPFVGSKISLVSKSGFRYEGTLYTIDTEQSTVALKDVRIFNENGSVAGDKVYNYIVFRGQDIKDLTVCSAPPPTMPSFDPSLQQPTGGFYGYNYGMPNYTPPYMSPYSSFYIPYMPPRMEQFNQQVPRQNLQQNVKPEQTEQPSIQQTNNLQPKSQIPQVIQKLSSTLTPQQPTIEPNKIVEPPQPETKEEKKPEKKKEEPKEQPKKEEKPQEQKVEPPKYSTVVQAGNKTTKSNQENKISGKESSKPSNQQHDQKKEKNRRGGRGKFQKGRRNYQSNITRDLHLGTPNNTQTKFTEEFDFESNLAKFSKSTIEQELKDKVAKGDTSEDIPLELPKKAYSKESFFDNISRDIGEQRMTREEREKQLKKDLETFGTISVNQRNQRSDRRFNRNRYNRRSKFKNYQNDNRSDNRQRRNKIFAPTKQNNKETNK